MGSKYLQEMEIVYEALVNVALYNYPFTKIEQHIGDDFMGYGTALDEILHGWKGFKWMIDRQRTELHDNKVEIKRVPGVNQIFENGRSALIVEEFEITMAMGQDFHGFTMRLSTMLEYNNEKWMIKHFHGSTADADTPEGNSWPIEEWKRRNAELKRVVAEKTIELSGRNKELKIEAALERVRASTMGMQKSEELQAVIQVVNEQMVSLNILVDHAGFIMDYKARDDMHIWLADPGGVPAEVVIPYFDSPHWNSFKEAKKTGSDFFANHLSFEEKNKFYNDLFEFIPGVEEETRVQYLSCPGLAISTVLLENVGLYIENFSGTPYTDEENETLMRFGKVFQQTYTRFLDLQKAEALTRETQVELSLERIRAQAMAMRQSTDLLDIVVSMQAEFIKLNHEAHYFWHMHWRPDTYEKAMTSGDGTRIGMIMELPRGFHGIDAMNEWELNDEPTAVFALDEEEAADYIDKMIKLGDFQAVDPGAPMPDDVREMGGLTFVMARTTHGEIGYSLPGVVPDPPAQDIATLVRFAGVFDIAYRRFEDLKLSEQQTRETQIELALEKVRSRTMAMQKSEELPEAANNLFLQVQELGIPAWSAGYCIWTDDKKGSTACMSSEGVIQKPFVLPNVGVGYNFQAPLEKGETFHIEELGGELISEHYEFMRTLPIFGEIIDGIIEAGHPLPTFQIFHICYFKYGYVMFITYESVPEAHDIFKRFAKVFEQTYTRFLDLEKAEAQAKEAQIEAALERVRSSAMVMQSSKDLYKVAQELRKQMGQLDYKDLETCAIHLYDESPDYFVSWAAQRSPESESEIVNSYIHFPKSGVESIEEMMEAYNSGKKDYVIVNKGKKMVGMLKMLKEYAPDAYKSATSLLKDFNPEDVRSHWTISDFAGGSLVMVTLDRPDDSAHVLLRRFANVFGLSYQRFKDLKRAEAQAREAQIENALEKVRSRTMAMQHSNELPDAANVLFLQVQGLGIPAWSCGYNILSADKKSSTCIMSSEGEMQIPFTLPLNEHESLLPWFKAIENKEEFFVYEQGGEDLVEHYRYMGTLPELEATFKQFEEANIPLPTFQVNHLAAFTNGFLLFITYERVPEAHEIFKRFAKVFEQTYTRFLDLQKAEAQAREAEIETALERLRAASMAMHHSEELTSISFVMFQEIVKLGIQPWNFAFFIFHGQSDIADCFSSDQTGSFSTMVLPHKPDKFLRKTYEDWKANKTLTVQEAKGRALEKHQEYMKTIPGFDQIIKRRRTAGVKTLKKMIFNNAHFKYGYIMINTLEPQTDFWDILQRIAKVFEQTYTRFLDLQKAEAQAREAEIETALERLRAASMAMHRSEELTSTSLVMFQELLELGIRPWNFAFFIFHGQSDIADCFASDQTGSLPTMVLPHKPDKFLRKTYEDWRAKKTLTVQEAKGKALKIHQEYMKTIPGFDQIIKQRRTAGVKTLKKMIFNNAHFKYGYIMINTLEPQTDFWDILQRIAKVFEQAYTRFLDLKKAEMQARDGQIEVAMERIRNRALAMHTSKDLKEVIIELRRQIDLLGELDLEASVIHLYPDGEVMFESIAAVRPPGESGEIVLAEVSFPVNAMEQIEHMIDMYHSEENEYTIEFNKEMAEEWQQVMVKYAPMIAERRVGFVDNRRESEHLEYWNMADFSEGSLLLVTHSPATADTKEVLRRAANVFDLAYKRFKDLQNAEAQAREAEIELALERVRARTMSMYKSSELSEAAILLYNQLRTLGIAQIMICGYVVIDEKNNTQHGWLTNFEGTTMEKFMLPLKGEAAFDQRYESWKRQDPALHQEIGGKKLRTHLEFAIPHMESKEVENIVRTQFQDPTIFHCFNFPYGYLHIITGTPISDDHESLLVRFTRVFEQTYTRFLDLQKAEEQTRKAQIEVAVERIRAQSMAMHHPDDLNKVNTEIYKQLQLLDINGLSGVSIWLVDENDFVKIWDLSSPGNMGDPNSYNIAYDATKYKLLGEPIRILKESKEDYFVFEYPLKRIKKALKEWAKIDINIANQFKEAIAAGKLTHQWNPFARHNNGILAIDLIQPPSEDTKTIVTKITGAFNLAYQRFKDLQKAQAQARESQIEAALERVRSRSMAMHKSEELADLSFELVKQVQSLGVATWFCAFNIYDDDEKGSLEWGSNAEGTYERYRTPREGVFLRYYEAGQRGEEFLVNEIGEDECPAHYEYLCSLPGVGEQLLKMRDAGIPFPTSQIDHVAFFKYGYILFITFEPEPESHDVFKRFAKVFEQTYTRFLDLQKAEVQAAIAKKQSEEIEMAYENLKATQTQLIQAEKMASLGELTAGIAHEIQNPLNFVNNFSEVSGELLDEVLEELEEGNTDDVKEIISDLKQNLEKIHHHGGRADSIVKGMLQHSRTSSGEKSPTDINELADEYLRLAYHGLRAKDNTFNAAMETDFDKSIGKIKVIPQDIGRVLLNLITNAFQAVHDRSVSAVHDRSKTSENGYKPKIDLTTNRLNDSTIEIIVADNGVGIPENIKDKIFQPFFTTKPTGQGTGLGLSLSYDIVKAHGGELIVESEEGQGTVFKIIL